MKVLITPIGSVIKLESIAVIPQEQVSKLENPENTDRIKAHLKDIHARHEIITGEDGLESHLYKTLENADDHDIKVLKVQHSSFLEHVHSMPEVIKFDTKQDEDKQEKKLKAASEILKNIEEHFEDNDFIVYGVNSGIFLDAFGEIRVGFMKELLDCYIDKHLKDENNNK